MGQRVAIVEDRESLALALEHLVSGLGVEVRRLGGEAATLDAIREAAPAVVILAAELDGRSGFDLCQAIRQDETLKAAKVLVLSMRCGRLGVEKAFALGADAFLPKPFAVSDLTATVRALLGGRPGAGEVPGHG